jgi:hypothetical protein
MVGSIPLSRTSLLLTLDHCIYSTHPRDITTTLSHLNYVNSVRKAWINSIEKSNITMLILYKLIIVNKWSNRRSIQLLHSHFVSIFETSHCASPILATIIGRSK